MGKITHIHRHTCNLKKIIYLPFKTLWDNCKICYMCLIYKYWENVKYRSWDWIWVWDMNGIWVEEENDHRDILGKSNMTSNASRGCWVRSGRQRMRKEILVNTLREERLDHKWSTLFRASRAIKWAPGRPCRLLGWFSKWG